MLWGRKSRIAKFWTWFLSHSERILAFEKDQERVFAELSVEMQKVDRNLCFEIGGVENGVREFVVSADGIRDSFPTVQDMVAAAPNHPQWRFTPFRPPIDLDQFSLTFGNVTLEAKDVWFSVEHAGPILHVDLFMAGFSPEDANAMVGASFIMLDMALGEYVVATRLGRIRQFPLDPSAETASLLPLTKLAEVVNHPVI